MTQQEKEKMFLDLNSVLVKFWKEQGRPDKEIKIELLERMLNWYKKMGTITLDKQSKEPVNEDLEKEIENTIDNTFCDMNGIAYLGITGYATVEDMKYIARYFANWQKGQDESRMRANIKLANTDVPVDTDMEIAFNDIWQDCEVRVERDGNLDEETTEAMKALCHDFFESGKEWQKSQMPMPEDTVLFNKGVAEGKRLMMEDAVEGYVNYYEDSGGILMAEAQVGCPYHIGDKMKIVIVPIKED